MENRTGRLDLLLLGIVERIASRDPVYAAVYQTFEPELRSLLKDLDSPRLRRAVKSLTEDRQQKESVLNRRKRRPAVAPASSRRKASARKTVSGVRSVVSVTAPDGKTEVVDAEWVS